MLIGCLSPSTHPRALAGVWNRSLPIMPPAIRNKHIGNHAMISNLKRTSHSDLISHSIRITRSSNPTAHRRPTLMLKRLVQAQVGWKGYLVRASAHLPPRCVQPPQWRESPPMDMNPLTLHQTPPTHLHKPAHPHAHCHIHRHKPPLPA